MSASRRRSAGRAVAFAGVAGLGGLALLASPAAAGTSDPRAVAALERAATAAHALSYGGTQYVSTYSSAGSSSVVLDVQHRAGAGSVVTVASSAGPKESVYALDAPLPGSSDLAVAGVDGAALRLLQQTYDLGFEPSDPSCVVVRAQDGRVAARFWLDEASGLVVRREVYGPTGRVTRASAFVGLRMSAATVPAARSLVAELDERRLELSEVSTLASAGWTVPRVLPGQLLLYDVRMQGEGAGAVVHLGYSDGLSTVSVFEQRGRLDKAAVRGWRHDHVDGADVWWDRSSVPTRAVWSARNRVWTVVADASPETVRAVVTQLPHEKMPHRGFWARIAHGLSRLISWLNPFD